MRIFVFELFDDRNLGLWLTPYETQREYKNYTREQRSMKIYDPRLKTIFEEDLFDFYEI